MRRKVNADEWTHWSKLQNEMYRPAVMLAFQGRIIEAIEEAERIQIKRHGSMYGVEFRCLTKTATVTANVPLEDGWAGGM